MEKYFHNEKFEFLVVETFDMGCYGFNTCSPKSKSLSLNIE
jgi:hypothetical protein